MTTDINYIKALKDNCEADLKEATITHVECAKAYIQATNQLAELLLFATLLKVDEKMKGGQANVPD